MATPRRVLSEINGNIIPYKDLSPYMRGKIMGKVEEGKSPAQIAKDLNIPDSTIRDTIFKDKLRNDGKSILRPGRPDKYSERFKRNLISFVRKEPKASMAKIRKHMSVKISNKAITRILDALNVGQAEQQNRHGVNQYTANSYLEVLEDQLLKIWEPGLIFMQDNALIHCANKTKKWFEDMAIPLTDWPPYSPDLNPIEHVWWHLKAKVLEIHPELKDLGSGEEAKKALEDALIEAWELVDDRIILACLESMIRRRDAVIAAKGWHTKY
ncbi:hypothetical protein B7463_g7528, partial [Scytalidium lignicola]